MNRSEIKKYLRKSYIRVNTFYIDLRVAYKEKKELLFIFLFGALYSSLLTFNAGVYRNLLVLSNGSYFKNSSEKSLEVIHIIEPLSDFIKQNKLFIKLIPWYFEENRIFPLFRFLISVYKNRPGVIVMSSHNPTSSQSSHFSYSFFIWLQKLLPHTKFFELSWDSVGENYWESRKMELFPRDFCVFDQTKLSNFFRSSITDILEYENLLTVFPTPFVEKRFITTQEHNRTVDFSFVGQISSYRDYRFNFIKDLKELEFNSSIYTSKSRKFQISHSVYIDLLKNSKISINFSQSVKGAHQIKLRVWEILLSGCLLLEQKNSETEGYFVDGTHFVSFDSKVDLIKKLNYYLNNQDLLNQIAVNGQRRAISLVREHGFEKFILSSIQD